MILTVTGRIGSGKDTFLKYLDLPKDCKLINADLLGHEILAQIEVVWQLKQVFPQAIIAEQVDRSILRKLAFGKRIKELNSIIHPLMIAKIKELLAKNTVINAALLGELRLSALSDKVIYIDTSYENITQRLAKKIHPRLLRKIINNQHSVLWYRRHADIVIKNNSLPSDMVREIKEKCRNLF